MGNSEVVKGRVGKRQRCKIVCVCDLEVVLAQACSGGGLRLGNVKEGGGMVVQACLDNWGMHLFHDQA